MTRYWVFAAVLVASTAQGKDNASRGATHQPVDTLYAGKQLSAGERLTSPSGNVELVMQSDGNLVLYHGTIAKWWTSTQGVANPSCHLQDDGNLVVYATVDGERQAVWAAKTDGRTEVRLVCQDDGNLVLYCKQDWRPWGKNYAWASDTACCDIVQDSQEFQAVEVRMDAQYKLVEGKSECVVVPEGVVVKVKRTRRVIRSVALSNKSEVEGKLGLEAGVPVAKVTVSAKQKFEEKLGTRVQEEETYEQEYQLNGDRAPAYKIAWTDKLQTGVVICRTYSVLHRKFVGQPVELKFEIIVGCDLKIEAISVAAK